MSKPIRIQRKRKKGWKMPKNTVYVGRPTKWGNHFKVRKNATINEKRLSVWYYETAIREAIRKKPKYQKELIEPLKGKNLACWCKVGEPCHADILLKLANKQ